jgi:glycosyltransferase involved in cell wall biosynthesis
MKTGRARKSLWMLNHYAQPPDLPGGTRHYDLACELIRLGYDVTIFASAYNHATRQKVRLSPGEPWALEGVGGIKFVWLPSVAYQGNNWRRMVNMLDYSWRAYALGRRLPRVEPQVPAPDIVMGCAVHLFAVLAGYHLSRHYRAHFVMEVRDLWPQTFLDMGVWREGQLQVRFFRWLEQFLYERAQRIVILSPQTRDYLADRSGDWADKSVYIPNGTQVARFGLAGEDQLRKTPPLQGMYLGAMGVTNGLDRVLQAIHLANQRQPGLIEWTFVGDGPEKPRLQQMAIDLGLGNVQFSDPVPHSQVPRSLAGADMLLLVQREVLYGSSNKLYDYMAAAKPILFAVHAQHNNLVEEAKCGVSALPDSAKDLADKLIFLAQMPEDERFAMGERGRAYVQQYHDYPTCCWAARCWLSCLRCCFWWPFLSVCVLGHRSSSCRDVQATRPSPLSFSSSAP